jgi:uncharacterized protein YhjY with autotransporter beta-barrel domain
MAPLRSRCSIASLVVTLAAAVVPPTAGAMGPPPDLVAPTDLVDASSTTLDLAALENQSVLHRIAALRAGARGVDFTNLTVQVGDQRLAGDSMNAISRPLVGKIVDGVLSGSDDADRFGVFTNGAVRAGKTGIGDDRAADAIDLTTGIDYRVLDGLVLGTSGGYSHDPERGALDISTWRGSLYGTYFSRDGFHVDALLSYGASNVDSARVATTDALGAATSIAKASADSTQLSGVLVGAFDWKYGPWAFAPRLGAQYLDADVDRLAETGGRDYDVTIDNQSAQSLRLNAGAQLRVAVRLPWIVLTPKVDADYVHDLADRTEPVDVQFSGAALDGSLDSSVRPTRTDPGYFVWSVGATAQWMKAISAFVSYRTFAGADTTTRELAWGLRFKATP